MRAKQFMFICIGLLALAAAYQLGVQRAEAQLGGEFTGIDVNFGNSITTTITTTGDIYARPAQVYWTGSELRWNDEHAWTYMGNVMDGVTVNAEPTTATDVKLKYREED